MFTKLINLFKIIFMSLKTHISNCRKQEELNDLIKPIRHWLKGDPKRNALIILSEPRGTHHLVLATNTTGNDMIPDMGMIVGMEPQLTDVLSLIVGEAMEVKPMQDPPTDWEDTINFTASCGDVPQPDSPDSVEPSLR